MKRVLQSLIWVIGAGTAVAVFVIAGRWSPQPLTPDLRGWLHSVQPQDAVVELARCAGIVVAGYVLLVAVVVLAADIATAARLVPVARLLRRLATASALPALRRWMVHASAATVITASSLSLAGAGVGAVAAAAPAQVVDMPTVALPDRLAITDFAGFDLRAATPQPSSNVAVLPAADEVTVRHGDTLSGLARARYGHVNTAMIAELTRINGLSDPNLIFPGQVLHFPAELTSTSPPPTLPDGAASWTTHRIVAGDTLWHILKRHYGYVDADLVWAVANHNGVTDPSDIPIGTDIQLPPLGAPGMPAANDPDTAATPTPPATVDNPASPAAQPAATVTPVTPPLPVTPPPPATTTVTPPLTVATTPAPAEASTPVSTIPMPTQVTNPTIAAAGPVPPPATSATVPTDTSHPVSANAGQVRSTGQRSPSPGASVPWLIGGAGSLVLAAGLAEWTRRRRRDRWAVTGSPWRIGPASEAPWEAIKEADLPLVEWAGANLARLITRDDPAGAVITTVELNDTLLTVEWDQLRPLAPEPWWATNGGRTWNLSRSTSLRPSDDDRRVGLPALVTFGTRGTNQFLVNLAALGSVTVDGPLTDEFVAALCVELAVGRTMSEAVVELVGVRLVGADMLDQVHGITSEQAVETTPQLETTTVTVVESDDPAAETLVAQATPGSGRIVIVLGDSPLPTGARVMLSSTGTAELEPWQLRFNATRVPEVLRALDGPEQGPPSAAALRADEQIATSNVVSLDCHRSDGIVVPRVLLRLFTARLPTLEPEVDRIGPTQMRIIAAVDSFGAGRAPARIAERLRLAVKTVRTHATPLLSAQPPLVHSDGEIWTLDSGLCSDAAWLHDLATIARDAPARTIATRALAECWEMLDRFTGPAYAGGAESKQWEWVHDHTDGPSPVDEANRLLVDAIGIATECWTTLAADDDSDLRAASSLVHTLLHTERAVRLDDPWPLLDAARRIAQRADGPTQHQVHLRTLQLDVDGGGDLRGTATS